MQKHTISVQKTARYFSLGTLDQNTKTIWFVLHGYAQTADLFLESLKDLEKSNSFIVAPEALSRFYWKDFSTKPVASWMTKLERETDIKDNEAYLDKLYRQVVDLVDENKVTINFLGFSQGVATLSRWLVSDRPKANNIFFYAGNLAPECDYNKSKNFQKATLHFIYGSKDFFINSSHVNKLKNDFIRNDLTLNVFNFEGKHQIEPKAIEYINKTTTINHE